MLSAINRRWVFEYVFGDLPFALFERAEKAAFAASVAGDAAFLANFVYQYIAIAIELNR